MQQSGNFSDGMVRWWQKGGGGGSVISRGVRYIDEILSEADISAFLKLSATYRYQKIEI